MIELSRHSVCPVAQGGTLVAIMNLPRGLPSPGCGMGKVGAKPASVGGND
jgi:hypothetical protein